MAIPSWFDKSSYIEANPDLGGVTPDDANPAAGQNDTFNSTFTNLNFSTIDGGGTDDTDTLNALDDGNNTKPSSVQNVEVINVDASNGNTFNAINVEGAQQYWSDNSQAGADYGINNIGDEAAIGMKGAHNDNAFVANFTNAVTDANNAVDVKFDSLEVTQVGTQNGAAPSIDGFSTFNLENTGTSISDNLGGDSLTTINISGTGDLTVSGVSTQLAANDQHARMVSAENFEGSALDYTFNEAGTEIDPSATGGVSYTGNSTDAAPDTEIIRFTGNGVNGSAPAGATNIEPVENTNEDSFVVEGGAGDTTVYLGKTLDSNNLDGDFDGTLTLNGGSGQDLLSFTFDDQASGTADLTNLLNLKDVSIQSFETVVTSVNTSAFGGGAAFDMSLYEGTNEYGFHADGGSHNVTLDADSLSDNFSLSFGAQDDNNATDNNDDLGAVTVNNIAGSSDQSSLTATLVADLKSDGGYTTGASDSDTGAINLNGATSDDAITLLTLNSEFSAELDPNKNNDPDVGNLAAGHGDRNDVGAISSQDSDGNEQLQSLTVVANTNVASGNINMISGTQDATDAFSIDLSGAGAVNLGTLQTGANVNGITVTNTGSGDRQIDLGANAGDLSADGTTAGQAGGDGVTLSGDGTGTTTVQMDENVLDGLTLDAQDAGNMVVAQLTSNINSVLDASNFSSVDQILIDQNDAVQNANYGISGISSETDVRITNDQGSGKILSLRGTGGSTSSMTVVLADFANNNEGLNDGLDADNVNTLTIKADVEDTGHDTIVVDGITLTQELPNSATKTDVVNLEAAADTTLDVTTGISYNTDTGSDQSLTVNMTGAGDVTVADVTDNLTSGNLTELNLTSEGGNSAGGNTHPPV